MQAAQQNRDAPQPGQADGLIRDAWYIAAVSRDVPPGGSHTDLVCGRSITFARDRSGTLTARAEDGTSVACTDSEDLVWVYIASPGSAGPSGASRPPRFDGPGGRVRFVEPAIIPAHQDDAAYGLLDPAHTPFVHKSPIWRGSGILKDKTKHFEPSPHGFTMMPHEPVNSDIYKIIGGKIRVRIAFRLPGLRAEYISNSRRGLLGLTALTPMDGERTRIRQIFYWDTRILFLIRPFARIFTRPFLQQDVDIMSLRSENRHYGGRGMLLGEPDRQFLWYHKLKREWQAAAAEGRAFVNPLQPATLHWRT
jgi:phenylpropionate dioxygenase-like ring-hydroxylating dioxygenase large terminal subunit